MNAPFNHRDQSDHEMIREALDRARRIETRLTRFLEEQGFDTGAQHARWRNGIIEVPSPACSIRDLLAAIPPEWECEEPIGVYVKGDFLMSFQAC